MTVIERAWVAVASFESRTSTVKLKVPASFGVPVMTPVVDFILSPLGRAPDTTVNL